MASASASASLKAAIMTSSQTSASLTASLKASMKGGYEGSYNAGIVEDLDRIPSILGSWTQTDDGIWHIVGHLRRREGEDTPTYLNRIQKNEDERMRWMLMGKTDSEQRKWYNNASASEREAKKMEIRRTVRAKRWWASRLAEPYTGSPEDDTRLIELMLILHVDYLKQILRM